MPVGLLEFRRDFKGRNIKVVGYISTSTASRRSTVIMQEGKRDAEEGGERLDVCTCDTYSQQSGVETEALASCGITIR